MYNDNHNVENIEKNPYYQILSSLNSVIDKFDDDKIYPVFRFGDIRTKDRGVLPLSWKESNYNTFNFKDAEISGFENVITAYKEAANQVSMYGPTSIKPIVECSIEYAKQNPREHIISFILCDGDIYHTLGEKNIVMQACDYPISFIVISVGPENDISLEKLNNMRGRKFDNVHCINFFTIQRKLERQK